jgi:DNA-binding transcriptional MerR regulator
LATDETLGALHSGMGWSEANDDEGWQSHPDAVAGENLTIGEMAHEFGATPRALRFYENKGLLAPRRHGRARLYGRVERERLTLVLKAKQLGFTLGEIRQMLDAKQGEFGALHVTRRQCFDQIKFLEQRKRDIEAALAELRRTYSSFYARIAATAV